MKKLISLADEGKLSDPLICPGIKSLDFQHLSVQRKGGIEKVLERKLKFIETMRTSPIAIETDKANEQHYALYTHRRSHDRNTHTL